MLCKSFKSDYCALIWKTNRLWFNRKTVRSLSCRIHTESSDARRRKRLQTLETVQRLSGLKNLKMMYSTSSGSSKIEHFEHHEFSVEFSFLLPLSRGRPPQTDRVEPFFWLVFSMTFQGVRCSVGVISYNGLGIVSSPS